MPRRVFLTGIAGLLGEGLARTLADGGHDVVGYDLRLPETSHPGVRSVAGDVRDVHRLYRALEGARPLDVIVHAGGISGSMVARDNPALIVDTNVVGTASLLEAARFYGARHMVLCSSIMVYGPTEQAEVGEDDPLVPSNAYGASKAACEALMHSYAAEFGLSVVALRLAHVYGPARKTFCPIKEMISGALSGRPVCIPAPADARRQFVHANDAIAALRLAVFYDDAPSLVANIGPGRDWALDEIEEVVQRVVGPVNVRFDCAAEDQDYRTGPMQIQRARQQLNWEPRVRLEDGIRDYARALNEARGEPATDNS
jgi:nucleoside-diphosphate-sugar epimerase